MNPSSSAELSPPSGYEQALAIADSSTDPRVPTNLNALLTRRQTADALTAIGCRISPATLASMATRGGGPPYSKWGQKPLHRWSDVLSWAASRLGPPRRSSAEADAA